MANKLLEITQYSLPQRAQVIVKPPLMMPRAQPALILRMGDPFKVHLLERRQSPQNILLTTAIRVARTQKLLNIPETVATLAEILSIFDKTLTDLHDHQLCVSAQISVFVSYFRCITHKNRSKII